MLRVSLVLYCPHCKKEVSKSTWYVHYNNFYDKKTDSWQSATSEVTHGTDLASKVADFDFDSMELEEFGDAKGNTDTSCEMIQDEYFERLSIHPRRICSSNWSSYRCAYIVTFGLRSDAVTVVVPINNFVGL